jgi:hypothetical protein
LNASQGSSEDEIVEETRADRRGAYRLHAGFSISVGANRIVHSGEHLRHLKTLLGDLGSDNVGVVAARDTDESVGLLDPGLSQNIFVDADPAHGLLGEGRAEALCGLVEGRLVSVDYAYVVALAGQDCR